MRTIQQIKQSIIDYKNTINELNTLNNTSATSIYNLWAYITAKAIQDLEKIIDDFETEIEIKISNSIWGTIEWYANTAKKFQLGDAIEQLPDNQPYSVIDTEKQIITRVSVKEQPDRLTFKVAKGNANNPLPLSNTEKTQFEAYIKKISIAGVNTEIVSLPADIIACTLTIEYDKQYNASNLYAKIVQAIKDFIFNINFDAILYKNDLIQSVEKIEGVINVNQDTAIITITQGTTITLGTKAVLSAGYAILSESSSSFILI